MVRIKESIEIEERNFGETENIWLKKDSEIDPALLRNNSVRHVLFTSSVQ